MAPSSDVIARPSEKFVVSSSVVPYHVLVVYNALYCSGTLLRSNIVITTASCITSEKGAKIFVKVGANSITGLGQVIPVIDIKIHEYFAYYSKLNNDVAMLVLEENVIFKNEVKKAVLGREVLPGTMIEVSGWGNQNLPQSFANMLLQTDMAIIDTQECIETYGDLITPSIFCAKYNPERHLTDTGGPAISKQLLVGILSYGASSTQEPNVAVFTNTSYLRKWIRLNTRKMLEKHCVPRIQAVPKLTMLSSEEAVKAPIV
ncbi:trypsin-5-like [Anticarsia gemmatalis]|uniref:trypsin-5-like n=1 Tax=Anticarsia gemmatalis TaxID=129554 RepID=UPI003F75FB15